VAEEQTHEISIQPEQASDGKTWYRAVCSCGQRIRHIHDRREGAERSGRGHIAINTPPPPGRYQLDQDSDEIRLSCLDCDQYLIAIHCEDDETRAIVLATAAEAHESRRHAAELHQQQPRPTPLELLPPIHLAPDDDSVQWTAVRRQEP
jgi:hypothetical protein